MKKYKLKLDIYELSNQKYAALWNGAIYGNVDSGEYISWR